MYILQIGLDPNAGGKGVQIYLTKHKMENRLTQFDSFDNFHFLISPVDFLKLVDFASADQDPRGR